MKQSQPLVSVVIISYNHKGMIEECINSVINQTYKSTELFVVDNGSLDGSILEIENCLREHRFRFIKNEKSRLVDSLNRLKFELNGDYVCFVAADDYFHEEKIATQVNIMEIDRNLGACSGRVIYVDQRGNKSKSTSANDALLNFEDIFLKKHDFPAPVAMIRKKALDEVNWYNLAYTIEDLQMWLKLSSKGWGLFYCGDILGYYRRHVGNISSKTDFMIEEQKRIISDYHEHELYHSAFERIKLEHFNILAKRDVKNALKVFISLNFEFKSIKLIIRGLIVLFTPFFILKYFGAE
ncbi:MAG: glycosyltransferase [Burkholderiales bacterium]|nr:glycosyltransferase [Burkholderiales bacterium]